MLQADLTSRRPQQDEPTLEDWRLGCFSLLGMIHKLDPQIIKALLTVSEIAGQTSARSVLLEFLERIGEASKYEFVPPILEAAREIIDDAHKQRPTPGPESFEILRRAASSIGMASTADQLARMEHEARQGRLDFSGRLNDLHLRISDDLNRVILVRIDQSRTGALLGDQLLGEKVADRFPDVRFDIEEAADCLALGKDTAAVFHLGRVAENGMRHLARSMGITNFTGGRRNWSNVLATIEAGLESVKSGQWKADQKAPYTAAFHYLSAVKDAWRNECMHIEGKYSQDEATRITVAVADFMGQVAKALEVPLVDDPSEG